MNCQTCGKPLADGAGPPSSASLSSSSTRTGGCQRSRSQSARHSARLLPYGAQNHSTRPSAESAGSRASAKARLAEPSAARQSSLFAPRCRAK